MIPSYLSFAGAIFPLRATPLGVDIAEHSEELIALGSAMNFLVAGRGRDIPLKTIAREGFCQQALWMELVDPVEGGRYLDDGPINGRRLSGHWPDLSDSFYIRADFAKRQLVIPRPVVMQLVERLRMLRAQVLDGSRVGQLDHVPVPPPPPLTPEFEKYERLPAKASRRAEALREELYARRG
jgi:hypothetical protein